MTTKKSTPCTNHLCWHWCLIITPWYNKQCLAKFCSTKFSQKTIKLWKGIKLLSLYDLYVSDLAAKSESENEMVKLCQDLLLWSTVCSKALFLGMSCSPCMPSLFSCSYRPQWSIGPQCPAFGPLSFASLEPSTCLLITLLLTSVPASNLKQPAL